MNEIPKLGCVNHDCGKCRPAPMEFKTDAEKIAYSYGWFKALELNPARKPWVGLTAQEAADCWSTSATKTWQAFEAKLKSKNA